LTPVSGHIPSNHASRQGSTINSGPLSRIHLQSAIPQYTIQRFTSEAEQSLNNFFSLMNATEASLPSDVSQQQQASLVFYCLASRAPRALKLATQLSSTWLHHKRRPKDVKQDTKANMINTPELVPEGAPSIPSPQSQCGRINIVEHQSSQVTMTALECFNAQIMTLWALVNSVKRAAAGASCETGMSLATMGEWAIKRKCILSWWKYRGGIGGHYIC
jgi:hypothetical protein